MVHTQAKWANEGLQTDTLSIENGAILNSAARWPLLIDPQLQGWRWITQKEGPNGLVILQQSQNKYLDKVRASCFRRPKFHILNFPISKFLLLCAACVLGT